MHNFITNFIRILDICKQFTGNRANGHGNVPRRRVVPTFSDLEVIALSLTACLAEDIRKDIATGMDGGETVFVTDSKPVKVCRTARAGRCTMGNDNPPPSPAKGFRASRQMYDYGYKLHAVCGINGVVHSYDMAAANVHDIHYPDDARWEYHDCLMLGDKGYLSVSVQQGLFETAHIKLEVACRLNRKNRRRPSWAYRCFRKRIGEGGLELILAESSRVNQNNDDGDRHDTAFMDSTVQEKNATFPADAKSHKKRQCVKSCQQ